MKKIIGSCAAACLMAGASFAEITYEWNGATTGGAWETATDWSQGSAPLTAAQDAQAEINGGQTVTMSSSATITRLYIGDDNDASGVMNTLILASGANLHSGVEPDGIAVNNATTVGRQFASTLTVLSGATFIAETRITLGRSADGNTPITDIADAKPSYLNILGGSVLVTNNGDIDLGNDAAERNSGGGVIIIDNGGQLEARLDFQFNVNTLFQSYVQLNDGTLIMGGDVDVQAMITDGTLKGDNLSWDYDETNVGKTTVIPEPATLGLIAAFGGGMLFIRRRFML